MILLVNLNSNNKKNRDRCEKIDNLNTAYLLNLGSCKRGHFQGKGSTDMTQDYIPEQHLWILGR